MPACLGLALLLALAACAAGTRLEQGITVTTATSAARPAAVATETRVATPGQPAGALPAAPAAPAARATLPESGLPGIGAPLTSTLPAGWSVFTDREAGYAIGLPPGVEVRSGKSPAGIYTARVQFRLPDVPGYQGVVIRVEPNPGGRGLEQILPQAYSLLGQEAPTDLLARSQQIVVAGLSAVRLAGAGEDFAVVVPYGDRVYYVAPVHEAVFSGAEPRALELFYRMLGTFAVGK